MLIRMSFQANVDGGIAPVRLGQILLDQQRLAMAVEYLAWTEVNPVFGTQEATGFAVVVDPEFRTYAALVNLPADVFRVLPGRLSVKSVERINPVEVSSILKVAEQVAGPVARNFKRLFNGFFVPALMKERTALENDLLREDVRAKRIANYAAAFGLAEKFPDPVARQQFLDTLVAAVAPFDPVLADVRVREEREEPRLIEAVIEPDDSDAPES